MIYQNALELIGHTPLVKLNNFCDFYQLKANLFGKYEAFNPTGSIKDRAAKNMIVKAEEEGVLKPASTIIEPTSGNTGIALAAIAAARGYKMIVVMPDSMSIERRKMMSVYGTEVILTPGRDGMQGAIIKAQELHNQINNSFIPSQFSNKYNSEAHYYTTGPEIYDDLKGQVDILIAGVGTGGTLTGTGKYLKEKNKDIKVIAVEPLSSAVLSGEKAGSHKIAGIGAGFVPDILDTNIYDDIIKVSDEDAFKYSKQLAKLEGLFVGISAGAALKAGVSLALKEENSKKNIVIILPDSGDRYLSTALAD